MKKMILSLGLVFVSSSVFAAPQYTLQEICKKYGAFNQCATVPFCKETVYSMGCYLAKGAPLYMEAMCKLQTQKQGCAIMQSQGNCVWVDQGGSSCDAKFESF